MKLLIETESKTSARQHNPNEMRKLYCMVFNTPEGKEVLQDLANMSGVFRSNFTLGKSDYVSFLEGHRALFFYICSHLENEENNIEGNYSQEINL